MSDVHFDYVPDFKVLPDGHIDKSDPMQYFDAVGMRTREKFVQIERAKIMQERISECFLKEGVNHHEMCKDLVKQYYDFVHQPDFGFHGLHYETAERYRNAEQNKQ